MGRKFSTIARNVFKGIGAVLDITGARPKTVYHIRSDTKALRSDWEKVGGDMWYAIRTFKTQNNRKSVVR